jgi:hypothetical protein
MIPPPLMMVPQPVHLHIFMGIMGVFPLDDREVILLACFISTENACLGFSFLFDITMLTAFVLQVHKWLKIFGLENHPSTYTQWPFPFILSHNLSTTLNAVLFSELMGCAPLYTSRL